MLEVEIYDSPKDDEPLVFEEIEYVSLYNGGTHGPPALVAPPKGGDRAAPRATVGDSVLYVNTSFVPLFKITRVKD